MPGNWQLDLIVKQYLERTYLENMHSVVLEMHHLLVVLVQLRVVIVFVVLIVNISTSFRLLNLYSDQLLALKMEIMAKGQ